MGIVESKMAASMRISAGRISARLLSTSSLRMSSEMGSGSGKGGGAGGSVRSAGGAFGKMEHAHEEQYFREQQQAQLKAIKEQQHQMAELHKREIKHHEELIKRHKESLEQYEKLKKKTEKEMKKRD